MGSAVLEEKIRRISACPSCKSSDLEWVQPSLKCLRCGATYPLIDGTPVMLSAGSRVRRWYDPNRAFASSPDQAAKSWPRKVHQALRPSDRVWTRRSRKALRLSLETAAPDSPERAVVLVGSGFEPVYRDACAEYREIIRFGLAHRGGVNIVGDVCELPMATGCVDLIFSSSVLEHVYDPDQAVAEMFRVIKPGGHVYAEIPFMRAYHMIPIDYQRYTIAGIEELFSRQGFKLLEKGICSGPFTTLATFVVDMATSLVSFNRYLKAGTGLALGLLMHPIKYFDRLCENAKWAEVTACNFYYLGRKEE